MSVAYMLQVLCAHLVNLSGDHKRLIIITGNNMTRLMYLAVGCAPYTMRCCVVNPNSVLEASLMLMYPFTNLMTAGVHRQRPIHNMMHNIFHGLFGIHYYDNCPQIPIC